MTNEQLVASYKLSGDSEILGELFQQNQGLIRKWAMPFTKFDDLADLVQQAYFGLVEAVNHYDDDRNAKFMTCAKYWIVQSIRRYVNRTALVKIPEGVSEKILKYKKTFSNFESSQGREPTRHEICKLLGCSPKEVDRLKSLSQNLKYIDEPTISDDAEEFSFVDSLKADTDVENTVVNSVLDERKAEIWKTIKPYISDREYVLLYRFSKGDSISKIAIDLGISKQRASVLRSHAIEKIRNSKARLQLQEDLDLDYYCGTSVGCFERSWNTSVEYLTMQRLQAIDRYHKKIS